MNNTRPKQQLSLYFVVFMHLFLCIFDGLFYVLELLLFNVSITYVIRIPLILIILV